MLSSSHQMLSEYDQIYQRTIQGDKEIDRSLVYMSMSQKMVTKKHVVWTLVITTLAVVTDSGGYRAVTTLSILGASTPSRAALFSVVVADGWGQVIGLCVYARSARVRARRNSIPL